MSSIQVVRNCFNKQSSAITFCSRWISTKPNINVKKINSNLTLKTLQQPNNDPRPLVILFSWMLAKDRHIAKYGNLYASEGFDVLSIKVSPTEVLRPKKAQQVVRNVLQVLEETGQEENPLLIHGFSVGGYVCGEMLVELENETTKYSSIRQRLVGQIFDSPVDYQNVPSGFSNVLSENKLVRKFLKSSIDAYLKLLYNSVTKYYLRSSEAFHSNVLKLPSLMLYSRADPVGVDKNIEDVIKQWRSKNLVVQSRCWQNTPHVSHFHHHPDEYVESILTFLQSVGIKSKETIKEIPNAEEKDSSSKLSEPLKKRSIV